MSLSNVPFKFNPHQLYVLAETNPLIFTQSSGYGKIAWSVAMATRGGCMGWATLDNASRNFTRELEGTCDVVDPERVTANAVVACVVDKRPAAAPRVGGGGDVTVETYFGSCACDSAVRQ